MRDTTIREEPYGESAAGGAGLADTLGVLRRRMWVVVLCVLAAAGGAVAVSLLLPETYTSSASLLFRERPLGLSVTGVPPPTRDADPEREAATNLRLVSLPVIADRTAAALGGGLTGEEVTDRTRVEAVGKSDLVRVEASARDPRSAARLASEFARQFVRFRRETDRASIRQAQQLVARRLDALSDEKRAGPRGVALRRRAEDLAILASFQTGNAQIVQPPKVPGAASSPRVARNGVLAGLLGLAFGLALAFLVERLDRRLKDPDEIATAVGLPVLAAIPPAGAIARADNGPLSNLGDLDLDPFRLLRANLVYFNAERRVRTLAVVSAEPDEGKTTVALNLALAGAETGARVLLVECDLRRPTLARSLGLRNGAGLASALADPSLTLSELSHQLPVGTSGGNGRTSVTLDVIVAGATPPTPTRLLESPRMAALLGQFEVAYDMVILDTPPLTRVPDAIPLVRRVDGVVVVARVGAVTRDSVRRLRTELEHLRAPTLGVVANFARRSDGYAYGYGRSESR